jgi:acyl-CoA synthetase (NDP forming)
LPPDTPAPGARAAIDALLHPRSVAIVGATERPGYGSRLLANLTGNGYAGRVVPVNPNRDRVLGWPCVPSVLNVPGEIDLAVIVIPAAGVAAALAECRAKGVPAAMVISAGFAELGTDAGRALEEQLARSAVEGPRLCGPNCLGVANLAERIWATANVLAPVDERTRAGAIGLVSQSGATAFGPLLSIARERGIGLRYVVSSGNEVDLATHDYVEYMLHDRQISGIACVLEGVRDGVAFRRVLEMAQAVDKPVVALKIGRTESGAAAALSHTAALTGRDDVFDALLRQCGAPRAAGWVDLIELADGLAKARRPRGRRVGVVSHSGGIGGLVADHVAAAGLEVPPLSPASQQRLAAILDGRGAARNPADITGHFERETFEEILGLLLADPSLDALAVATAGGIPVAMRVAAAAESQPKPLVLCWTAGVEESESLRTLREAGMPLTYDAAASATLLAALVRWSERRATAARPARARDPHAWAKLRSWVGHTRGAPLPLAAGLELLQAAGVPSVRAATATEPSALADAAAAAGLRYPLAVKLDSPDLPHKSDVDAVRLGIDDRSALIAAAADLAGIGEGRRRWGFVAQEMAPAGLELVLGLQSDAQLGPAVMLGLGGFAVEALRQRAWRLPPFGRRDAEELVDAVAGLSALLAGVRGRAPLARDDLLDAIEAFAAWAGEVAVSVESAEVNPLIVSPTGVLAVDCWVQPRLMNA